MGIKTTKITKRIGCANLKAMIENHQLILNDFELIQQLTTYVVDKQTFNAEEGHHDDLVMCLVLFAWMISQNYFKESTETDIRKKILENNEREMEENLTPFGIFDDGMPEDINNRMVSNEEFDRILLN